MKITINKSKWEMMRKSDINIKDQLNMANTYEDLERVLGALNSAQLQDIINALEHAEKYIPMTMKSEMIVLYAKEMLKRIS